MTRMPGALWLPISRNFTNRKRTKTNALILHIAASEATSLRGWFNNPKAGASSHLYVRRDGTIEQYLDLDVISWANGDGNWRSVTVETQGMGHGKWTDAQVEALAKIARFVHERYGVPLVLMGDSRASTAGVGYHRLGVDPWRVRGGERWSKWPGKICPGPERIEQIPLVVAKAKGGTPTPAPAAAPAPKPAPARKKNSHAKRSYAPGEVKAIQAALAGMGYYKGALDGDYGPVTQAAVRAYQEAQRYRPGVVVDGDWGPKTEAHFEWTKRLQVALNAWKAVKRMGGLITDGDFGPVTQSAVIALQRANKGGAYKGVVDGIPGPVTCRMLGIPAHPGL